MKLKAPKENPVFMGNFVAGEGTTAVVNNFVIGKYNKEPEEVTEISGDLFIVGNGSSTEPSNALRVSVSGNIYGTSEFNSSGADMAEYFEWEDGNIKKQDRRGLFVTLSGEKIKKVNTGDFILGVVASNSSYIGDAFEDVWKGKYLTDIFGSVITKDGKKKINPSYNPNIEYIPRSQRPEWDVISSKGKVVMVDDGTCRVNFYCKPSQNGIATHSEETTNFRVMKRLDSTHIRMLQY